MNFFFLAFFLATVTHALTPFEPQTAWKTKSIKVCWGKEAHKAKTLAIREALEFIGWSEQHKKWIKDIVTKEFTLTETGLEFIGWDDCDEKVSNAEVVLFRTEPPIPEETGTYTMSGGRATVGYKGEVVNHLHHESQTPYTTYETSTTHPHLGFVILNTRAEDKRMDSEPYIKMIALHEFGHTAGMRHQHVRIKNVKEDPNCKKVPELNIKEEPAFASTRFAGAYDHNSIMNYCYINVLAGRTGLKFEAKDNHDRVFLTDPTLFTSTPVGRRGKKYAYVIRIGLSEQDKKALKCMYVFTEAERIKECNQPK